ncbi:hypothetical protein A3G50_00595 [Candidatus Jorgensenbacteria bacterium RIFCSPLOWO2_12_FULL_42_11]|uniref:Peptidase S74 domain-containing protein n=1 Tax=Candidatus Jorgensenbacteria bacterium RIFCSPLOWO2_12_FULL_42_11 TaxID=1798473 RepID=A0A1F6C270_9BACT|nr:MAG: hypothetical protein A3G50_00595 [Candidatus Jorgensenbacteria bacterium RIFCSPLOWO2_12_FULL_42_11]
MSIHFLKSLFNKSRFFFNLVSGLAVGLLVGVAVLAFNNPTSNPTTGGGIIGVGSGAPASSLYINSTGNVGIGDTNPVTRLEIADANKSLWEFGNLYIRTNNAQAAGIGGSLFFGGIYTGSADTSWASIAGQKENGTDGNFSAYLQFGTRANSDGAITERMRITSAGNVGIGTASPGYKLDVNGNVNATAYYGSGANLTGVTVADNSISTAKLKTTTGEVSVGAGSDTDVTLPGGEYGFYPQIKASASSGTGRISIKAAPSGVAMLTTYTTRISLYHDTNTIYAKQRYVTASGEDMWIFLLVDKDTKEIMLAYQAPDHPAYGNGGDFNKLPHPFGDYDSNTQDIVLIEKDQAKAIQREAQEKNMSVLELIDSEYKIDLGHIYDYKPIHSGQFLETKPVLVEHIPDYIQVRKFVEMTDTDKQAKKALQEEKQRQSKQDKQSEEQRHRNAVNKLKALGLTEEDLKEIIK